MDEGSPWEPFFGKLRVFARQDDEFVYLLLSSFFEVLNVVCFQYFPVGQLEAKDDFQSFSLQVLKLELLCHANHAVVDGAGVVRDRQ